MTLKAWWGSVLTWGHCVTVGGKISSVPWWGSVLTWGHCVTVGGKISSVPLWGFCIDMGSLCHSGW